MSQPFRYYLRVRYAECDAQKVVFNAHYGHYLDLASLEFFRALGLADQMVNGPLDYQLVKQTIEWKSPARFDQVLEISLRAAHMGNTSFAPGCRVSRRRPRGRDRHGRDDLRACRCRHACKNIDSGRRAARPSPAVPEACVPTMPAIAEASQTSECAVHSAPFCPAICRGAVR